LNVNVHDAAYTLYIEPSDRPLCAVFLVFALVVASFSARRSRIERELRNARDQLRTEVAERTQPPRFLAGTTDRCNQQASTIVATPDCQRTSSPTLTDVEGHMDQSKFLRISLVALTALSAAACSSTGGTSRISTTSLCQKTGGSYVNGTCQPAASSLSAAQLCANHGGVYMAGGDYCEVDNSLFWKP
jgi:hypothetical protein